MNAKRQHLLPLATGNNHASRKRKAKPSRSLLTGAAAFSHACCMGVAWGAQSSCPPSPGRVWSRHGRTGSWLQKAGAKQFPRETAGCKRWVHGHRPGRETLASSSMPCPARSKPPEGSSSPRQKSERERLRSPSARAPLRPAALSRSPRRFGRCPTESPG